MNDDKLIDDLLDCLFTNGQGQKAHRLLLIQELASGDAQVVNGTDLGGFSRAAVRDVLATDLAAARQDERAAILKYMDTFEGEISGLLPMITADLECGMHLEAAGKEGEAGRDG